MIANVNFNDFDIPMKNPINDDEDSPMEQECDVVKEAKDILKTTELVNSNEVGYGDSIDYTNDSELLCYFGNSDEEDNQFMAFMNEVINSIKEKSEAVSTVENTLPAIEAAPFEVDYNTPDVYWSQTMDSVQLVIKLPNVQTYKLTVGKSRMLSFQTTVNEKKYELHLMLYESVEKEFTQSLGGLEITVKLKKKERSDWPKLSRSKKRLRNIHYMLNKDEGMEDEQKKLLMDIGDELNIDWSSDEGAPLYHVESDLDSEYDQDLPDDLS